MAVMIWDTKVLEDRKIKYEKEKNTRGIRGRGIYQETQEYHGEASNKN